MITRVVDTSLGPVEYSEAGTGPPVLYLHGIGVTGDAMLEVESALVDDGFRLIVPNRPGYGKTPLADQRTSRECAEVMVSLLDLLELDKVSVMGSSGGGAFAAAFAARFPGRVQSLVLLCPLLHRWSHNKWVPKSSRWIMPLFKRPFWRGLMLKAYRKQLARMKVEKLLKMEAGKRYREIADDMAARAFGELTLKAMVAGGVGEGFANDFAVFLDEDVVTEATAIAAPTMILHDDADPMAPAIHVDWFAATRPQCEVVKLRVAGHLVWIGPDSGRMHRQRVGFIRDRGAG